MAVAKKTTPTGGKFVLDCTLAHKDNILDPQDLQKFLSEKIKVDGKTGNFKKTTKTGEVETLVAVELDGSKISVEANLPFKKRYIKYLTKKYLAKQQIRDFFRVIATGRNTYALKYFGSASKKAEQEA